MRYGDYRPGTIPAEEAALYAALEELPKTEVERERIVEAGRDPTLPLR